MVSSVARLAKCMETIKTLTSPYFLLNLDGSSSGSGRATLDDVVCWPDMSWTLPHRQASQWAKLTATWMRHSTKQMARVVQDLCYGPASYLTLGQRMDEALRSMMFADPMD